MGIHHWIQLLVFVFVLLFCSYPLALYMDRVFSGKRTWLTFLLNPLERFFYRILDVNPTEEQGWKRYTFDLLSFSFVTFLLTFFFLKFQHILPLNPQNMGPLSFHLTLNTAVSFLTNTNWQSYSSESTMSYFSQMVALTFQNFASAAVGMAVALTLIRGIARRETNSVGNFWVDLVRSNLYVLLPISFVFALFLISQGVVQNFLPYTEITTLEGAKQLLPQGPAASQVAIKLLGTNGGGFFNANSAHPIENPTALSNFVQMISMFLIPSSFVFLLGHTVKSNKHAWAIWISMFILFFAGVFACAHYEHTGNPLFSHLGLSSSVNMEGKETRFGTFASCLFGTVATDTSCGAVNAAFDSFTPLGGFVPLINMKLGEIIFGGVGSGLYGMVLFIILSVFIAGLMVGRTPEYLGKKIEALDVKLAISATIIPSIAILVFTAIASVLPLALSSLGNPGAHGLSEIMYAFTSAAQNNGSAFAGLNANTPFWNIMLSIAMLIGRFIVLVLVLFLAGSLASKKIRPVTESSFPVHGPVFVALLLGVIIIVGALTYFPVLSLGPIVEHLQMNNGLLY